MATGALNGQSGTHAIPQTRAHPLSPYRPQKKGKTLAVGRIRKLGDTRPLFLVAHLSENLCSVFRDDMGLQVSTDLVLRLVLTPVNGFFICFTLVVCCS